jgi:hypothetical protein
MGLKGQGARYKAQGTRYKPAPLEFTEAREQGRSRHSRLKGGSGGKEVRKDQEIRYKNKRNSLLRRSKISTCRWLLIFLLQDSVFGKRDNLGGNDFGFCLHRFGHKHPRLWPAVVQQTDRSEEYTHYG